MKTPTDSGEDPKIELAEAKIAELGAPPNTRLAAWRAELLGNQNQGQAVLDEVDTYLGATDK